MVEQEEAQTLHSIGVVSRRTGLKPDVIRAWERRYRAIVPARTGTNRRFYTDEQVERLVLLRKATLSGRQIGQVSHLSTEALRDLVASDQAAIARAPRLSPKEAARSEVEHFEACLAAVEDLDSYELQLQLERASVELSHPDLMHSVLGPLLSEIGELWGKGRLRIAHEHMAIGVIRTFLVNLQADFVPADNSPGILLATPARQQHELGALMAAATAAAAGWRVLYLGASLPAEEIAAAVRQKALKVLALSLVYPADDPHLDRELRRLRRLLGPSHVIIIGGEASASYRETIAYIEARRVESLAGFRELLRTLRTG